MLGSGLALVVILEHGGGVLLRGFEGINLNFNFRASLLIVVLAAQNSVPFFESVEVCGDQLRRFADLLAILALLKLGISCGQLSLLAVAQRADGFHQLMAAPPLLFQLVAAGIEAVEHVGKALRLLAAQRIAVLGQAHEAEIHGLFAVIIQIRVQLPRLYAVDKGVQQLRQICPVVFAAAGKLPAYQRGKPREAFQKPLVDGPRPVGLFNQDAALRRIAVQKRRLRLRGRIAVKHARQHTAQRVPGKVRAAHAVHDAPLAVDQNEIGAAPDELRDQGLSPLQAELVPRLQLQLQHTLVCGLCNGEDARADQVLAQEHAEHGRLGRVFKA